MRINLEDFQIMNVYGYKVRYIYVRDNVTLNIKHTDSCEDRINATMLFNISDIFKQYSAKLVVRKNLRDILTLNKLKNY